MTLWITENRLDSCIMKLGQCKALWGETERVFYSSDTWCFMHWGWTDWATVDRRSARHVELLSYVTRMCIVRFCALHPVAPCTHPMYIYMDWWQSMLEYTGKASRQARGIKNVPRNPGWSYSLYFVKIFWPGAQVLDGALLCALQCETCDTNQVNWVLVWHRVLAWARTLMWQVTLSNRMWSALLEISKH